jgi:hypothetical protein
MLVERGSFLCTFALILLCWQCAVIPTFAAKMVSSKPVVVGPAAMTVTTLASWTVDAVVSIDFCITNNSKHFLVFPLFDKLKLIIKKPDGNFVTAEWGRDKTRFIEPVIIASGKTEVVSRSGKLSLDKRSRRLTFDFNDQTGAYNMFRDMQPGEYDVAYQYANSDKVLKPRFPEGKSSQVYHEPCWTGSITTKSVRVNLVAPNTLQP